jgi:hypothetical protein
MIVMRVTVIQNAHLVHVRHKIILFVGMKDMPVVEMGKETLARGNLGVVTP